jgi:hypothetical protein
MPFNPQSSKPMQPSSSAQEESASKSATSKGPARAQAEGISAQATKDATVESEPPLSNLTRWMLLLISLTMLLGSVIFKFSPLVEPGSREFAAGTLFKVGMVLGLAWLALPQLERFGWQNMRGTGLAVIIAIGALSAIRPRFGAIAAAIAVGGFLIVAVLGWVRGVIFNGAGAAIIHPKSRKIEKNPTKR